MTNRLTLPLADWVGAASLAQVSDAQLLHRFAKAGEQHAFAMLVKRHGPMVWGVARRLLRSHQDAEDTFQAVFLVLAKKASTLRQPHLLASWLHGVTHRTALHVRSRLKVSLPLEPEREIAGESSDEVAWRDCGIVIDRAIEQLPASLRIVFLLCQAEGLTTLSASKRLSLPEGTVVSRLHRARKQLQQLLARHGITSAAGAVTAAWCLALPESLSAFTVRSILGSTPSALVVGLAQGVLTTMMWMKLTTAAVVVSSLGLVGAGAATFINPGNGYHGDPKVASLPAQEQDDNKDVRIKKLMRELEAARAEAAKAMALERQLRDQLEAERQRSNEVKKFLQNNLLAQKKGQDEQRVELAEMMKQKEMQNRQAEEEARLRNQELIARKQAERMQEVLAVQQQHRRQQMQSARDQLSAELEKLQRERDEVEKSQQKQLVIRQQVEAKYSALERELDNEIQQTEKQVGSDHPKLKELKDKRKALIPELEKWAHAGTTLRSTNTTVNRLTAQIKLREKLLLEVEEKILRQQLRLDD